jgi:hypothetical protein
MSEVFEHLDEVLQRLTQLRDELLINPAAPNREARLAAVFECEARLWSQFYELTSLRLVWRAALAAEAGARINAALWAGRPTATAVAASQPAMPVQNRVAGPVGAPRLVALAGTAATSDVSGGR